MEDRTSGGATTLPGEFYTSPELFDEERERIFSRSWLYSGHVSQIPRPGDYFLATLDGESVIVTRDSEDRVQAFYNVCRHRGTRMCSEAAGHFQGGIQCPYHAWTWGFDGCLKAAPNMREVVGFAAEDYPLRAPALAVFEGMIFINLSSTPPPFDEVFGPLMGKFDRWGLAGLRSVHQTVYEVEANWKLFFQNYSECYHCPNVHPVLNKLTPYRDSSNDLDEGPFLGGPMTMSAGLGSSMTMTSEACGLPLGELSGEDLGRVYYYTLFPSMFLSLHPDYVLIHRGVPEAVDRTRIYCDWYFHPDAIGQSGFDPSGAVEFWDMTNRQDWHLCTIAQQGIASRAYTPGPYAELESQLAAFDREYLKVLGRDS